MWVAIYLGNKISGREKSYAVGTSMRPRSGKECEFS